MPLVNRTAQALGAWLGAAFDEKYPSGGLPAEREQLGAKARMFELRPDLDQVEGLSSEREALWARLTFLFAACPSTPRRS